LRVIESLWFVIAPEKGVFVSCLWIDNFPQRGALPHPPPLALFLSLIDDDGGLRPAFLLTGPLWARFSFLPAWFVSFSLVTKLDSCTSLFFFPPCDRNLFSRVRVTSWFDHLHSFPTCFTLREVL